MKSALKRLLSCFPLARDLHAHFRGTGQEREAEWTQREYERLARERGFRTLEGEELARAVLKRLASRAAGRWPKPLGHLHLFLAYYVSNWEAILSRVLMPFGKVTAFNWREHGFDDRHADWLQQRDAMNDAMLKAFYAANAKQPIDVVVGYLSGYNTAPETLREMAAAGAAVFNLCWDDKLSFPGQVIGGRYTSPAAIADAVDLNLTNSPYSVVKYAVHDGLAMFWPEAAHPDVHRPYVTPFEFDVSFAGACYGRRPAFMRTLARQGVHVECFGRGWPNGHISDEEMVRLYSRTRINLGFSEVGYARNLFCLKGRDFEVPMSGGLYLTRENPELGLVFDVGREIAVYRDAKDCVASIRHLLADPDLCARIRQTGRARCLKYHTYLARWKAVLALSGILE